MVDASEINSHPRFALRLSAEERKQWEEAAEQAGFKHLGTWLKWVVRWHLDDLEREGPCA